MKLKLISKERPSAVERRKRNPRDVVIETIDLQITAIEHSKRGEEFTVQRERYVNVTENGRDRRVKTMVNARPKPWWWQEGGVHFVQARFGTHLIEVAEGKATIECGKTLDDVVKVLQELRRMVETGELDQPIYKAREKAKKR
ncbi:MAG: hypothetical protein VR70_05200 [Rhodospirillaceae bacterium BRH_c57]|nr:MAG: hypothetical protein VR70_05200 [Rhodospirillaceae bacterium BRH_c57]